MGRRIFTREFKLEGVKLVQDRGVAVREVARDLDVHENEGSIEMSAPMYLSNGQGIFQPTFPVHHEGEHYDEKGFKTLFEMQSRHFWYRGRHRFLMHSVARNLPDRKGLCGIDLGGGCGGWLNFLFQQMPGRFEELALADSSLTALELAKTVIPKSTTRYQIDLMDLHWENRWDVAFLLDVIEHLPNDAGALVQVCNALKPGGLLFVTTPALQFFWTYNDDFAHHLRRYSKRDYAGLAEKAGLQLLDSRYFMFFLSPLLWLSRTLQRTSGLSEEERSKLATKAHEVPTPILNHALAATFAAETPVGHWLPFPWGTSILGIFQKSL